MGMGRAFQYAGARSVVMSLWSVSENATVELMDGMFQNLAEGEMPRRALSKAQTRLRKAGYEHPFYWGAFIAVSTGDE